MHLLFFSYWYAPEPVNKPHEMAAELVRRGHRVHVITGVPSYPTGVPYPGYRRRILQKEIRDGVEVIRVPSMSDRSRSGLRRLFSLTSYAASAAVAARAYVRRPDAIWTYQVGLPAFLQSLWCASPWVHEVQDLWPDWSRSSGLNMLAPLYGLLTWEEALIYRRASHVTTISNGFARILGERGVPEERITVLPNWANDSLFLRGSGPAPEGADEGLAGKFNVVYAGNIGPSQGLEVVVEAASLLATSPDIQFVLIGDGIDRTRLQKEVTRRRLQNVLILGRREPAQIPGYLAWAEVVLVHLKKERVYEITIPSKTYAYLASEKPILAAASGEVASLVADGGAGLVCEPEDPAALAATVRRFYDMSSARRREMGQAGRRMFETRFSRAVVVQHYEDLFTRLNRDSAPAP